MTNAPWSKLERRLRDLPDPALDLRFRFTSYRQDAIATPFEPASKLWITVGRSTLWAVPRDRHVGDDHDIGLCARRSPGWLVEIAAEYLDVARGDLLDWTPAWSGWGLVDILKACDRRIGRRRWPALRERLGEPTALGLLARRAGTPLARKPVAGRNADQTSDPN